MNCRLFSVSIALLTALIPSSESQAARRLIEVGVDIASGAVGTPLSEEEAAAAFSVNGSFDFNFLFFHASADAGYTRAGGDDAVEILADGGIAFAKIHELYIREGGPNGDMLRVMGGFGGNFGLGALGELTLSAGVISMDWTRPGSEEQSLLGLYAGTKVFLKIWKFENELRVAYYAAPQFNPSTSDVAFTDAPLIEGWNQGVIASERLRFNAFKISIFEFGPELRARFANLPDGTEWMATVGFGGRIGVL